MTVLVITGSARQASFTRRLGEAVAGAADGGELAQRLTGLPYFDQDREDAPPAAVQRFRAQVRAADLVVVITPEYNGTIPGLLGNAVDWLSRPYAGGALQGKPVLAVAASPGGVGGARALVSLRTVLGNAGAVLVGPGELVPHVDALLGDPGVAAGPAVVAAAQALLGAAGVELRARAHAA